MKLHGIPMTEHTYNGLIRVYAGAAGLRFVKEEHIDMYIQDSHDLVEQIKKDENVEINV